MLSRFQIRGIASLLTIVMHVVLVSPSILGTQVRKSHGQLASGMSASAAQSTPLVSTLVWVKNNSPASEPDESTFKLSAPTDQVSSVVMDNTALGAAPQLQVSESEDRIEADLPAVAISNQVDRAPMVARYLGQITSRIQRAWRLPSTLQAAHFHCRVQIRQDVSGAVQEVTLQGCDEDAAVQLSLVNAIQSASPLPVLPADNAFGDVITLDFDAASASADARITSVMPSASDF